MPAVPALMLEEVTCALRCLADPRSLHVAALSLAEGLTILASFEATHVRFPVCDEPADRWRLVNNLADTLEAFFRSKRTCLKAAATTLATPAGAGEQPRSPPKEMCRDKRRPPAGALARAAVSRGRGRRRSAPGKLRPGACLHAAGMTVAEMARTVGIARMTVDTYLREGPPQRKQHTVHGRQRALEASEPDLLQRWEEGCRPTPNWARSASTPPTPAASSNVSTLDFKIDGPRGGWRVDALWASSRRSLGRTPCNRPCTRRTSLMEPVTGGCPSPHADWPPPEAEKAAALEVYFSQLIAKGDWATLYRWMHPDAQAHVSEPAMAGWFAANVVPTHPRAEVVDKVRFVDWIWPVTGRTYPLAAEINVHYETADGVVHDDVAHLVRDHGVWRWLFGRDAAFVADIQARYGK
jgi:hypothetical protein